MKLRRKKRSPFFGLELSDEGGHRHLEFNGWEFLELWLWNSNGASCCYAQYADSLFLRLIYDCCKQNQAQRLVSRHSKG